MTSRAVRLCKRTSKNSDLRFYIILENVVVHMTLWCFIVTTLFLLCINNILKFIYNTLNDVNVNYIYIFIRKQTQYLESINNNLFILLRNIVIFVILKIFIIVSLLILLFSNCFKISFNIVNFLYLKCVDYFSKTLEYIENNKLYDHSSRRIIYDRANKNPYLIRYYLLFTDRDKFPFNVFIHKFMTGDDDEDPHDHPWGFFHIILSGGYWEQIPLDDKDGNKFYKGFYKVWRQPGYWNIVNSKYTHRVDLDDTKPKPWTLFIPFKHNNEWGFWVKNSMNSWSKINHKLYLKNKDTSISKKD